MIKVMMVVEATTGGTGRHVVELAAACHRRGLAVHVVCAVRRDPAIRTTLALLRASGLAVDECDMRREVHPLHDGAAAMRLRSMIVDARPDVLHLHSSKAGAVGRGAVVGLGRRSPAVVYTPHAYAFLSQAGLLNRWRYWCAERALMPWTDRVVAVSASEGRAADRLGAGGRVVIIPNGIDLTRFAFHAPAEHTPPLRIGWLGRLAWQKDPEAAVRTSAALSRSGVDHELLMAGDGPDRDRVEETIDRLDAHAVRMLGHVEETGAFYDGIDVLLMTSRSDGLPYAGLDAMAHGVPIVGFDVDGVQDLVEHGVTGLLAQTRDPAMLAIHIVRLARDPAQRQALGDAARRRVQHEFRFETQVTRLCSLYETLAGTTCRNS